MLSWLKQLFKSPERKQAEIDLYLTLDSVITAISLGKKLDRGICTLAIYGFRIGKDFRMLHSNTEVQMLLWDLFGNNLYPFNHNNEDSFAEELLNSSIGDNKRRMAWVVTMHKKYESIYGCTSKLKHSRYTYE